MKENVAGLPGRLWSRVSGKVYNSFQKRQAIVPNNRARGAITFPLGTLLLSLRPRAPFPRAH